MLSSMKKQHQQAVATLAVIGVFVAGGVVIDQRGDSAKSPVPTVETTTTPETPSPIATAEPLSPSVEYRSIKVITDTPGAEIAAAVGLSNVPFVLSFNRMDERHIQKNSTVTIPPTFTDWNSLSPFPSSLPAAVDIPQLLLVSQRVQAVAAYEHGTLVRWMVTSTGKKDTPTPNNLYFTNWKGKLVISTLEGGYKLPWAFNIDSMGGIAMHQFDLPGFPASHACIRLLEADAIWIYDWAKQWILAGDGQTELAKGTPVIVFGEYAFGKVAPWKKLATDPNVTTLTVDELTDVVNKNIDAIHAAAQKRAEVEKSQ